MLLLVRGWRDQIRSNSGLINISSSILAEWNGINPVPTAGANRDDSVDYYLVRLEGVVNRNGFATR